MPNTSEAHQPRGRATAHLGEQHLQVEALEQEVAQLREALASRIVIEQAKGVLAERYGLTVADAFLLLRSSARGARTKIHGLATQVASTRESPEAVIRALARDKRLRPLAVHERAGATAERAAEAETRHGEQHVSSAQRSTARIRTESRSDAVDLASRLGGYRWYLIVSDDEHWEVVVEFTGDPNELPAELRAHIDGWLRARPLRSAHVQVGDLEYHIG